jgi:pimeloyl-ACP methyl ester carboxylesterase
MPRRIPTDHRGSEKTIIKSAELGSLLVRTLSALLRVPWICRSDIRQTWLRRLYRYPHRRIHGHNDGQGVLPDDLLKDALAALRFLRTRHDVDKKRIGFWGSSEGGMLATQVAARSRDVAFAINSSGFMGELWQTTLYQAESYPRHYRSPAREVKDSVAFTKQWLDVARIRPGGFLN